MFYFYLKMRAWVLHSQGTPLEEKVHLESWPEPVPSADELLVRVKACALCRTDLHIVEGDIPAHKLPVILGHQVVGVVEKVRGKVKQFKVGDRVGIPWLNSVDESCPFCRKGQENLCQNIKFTGYDVDGGFAEYTLIKEGFAYRLPENLSDLELAPLLCGGVIGYRSFRLSEISPGENLGLYGFGSSAHIILQLALKKGITVFARSRGKERLNLAIELGAVWAGNYQTSIPEKLQAVIIFAPSGDLVPLALKDVDKGGRVILAGIHMTPIPTFDYSLIYEERLVKSVANSTRQDVKDFLEEASRLKVLPEITVFPFEELLQAMKDLKEGKIAGTAVLSVEK